MERELTLVNNFMRDGIHNNEKEEDCILAGKERLANWFISCPSPKYTLRTFIWLKLPSVRQATSVK
jgi:hypothetical protein